MRKLKARKLKQQVSGCTGYVPNKFIDFEPLSPLYHIKGHNDEGTLELKDMRNSYKATVDI